MFRRLLLLLVCLIPTTIGALLAAIGIAGMDRALQANIIAKSGKAVETAGDIDRCPARQDRHDHRGQSSRDGFMPVGRYYSAEQVGRLAGRWLRSLMRRPEGKTSSSSILTAAELPPDVTTPNGTSFIAFSAQTRMSGIDLPDGSRSAKERRTR